MLELATMCSQREANRFYTFRNVFLLSGCRWGYFESLALVRSPASLEASRALGSHVRCPFAITSPQVSQCIAIGIWTLNEDGAQRPRETSQHLGWIPWP